MPKDRKNSKILFLYTFIIQKKRIPHKQLDGEKHLKYTAVYTKCTQRCPHRKVDLQILLIWPLQTNLWVISGTGKFPSV